MTSFTDPRANNNKGEREVDAKKEEATLALKVEGEEGDRVVPEPVGQLPVGQARVHTVVELLQSHLCHLKLAKLDCLPRPLILHVASVVTKAANLEGAFLAVEWELSEVHRASSPHCQSLRVGDTAVGIEPDEPVWRRHLVQVALLAVDEDGVWPPDLCQRFPVKRDLSDATGVELESWVRPGLPEVAVETVHLMVMTLMTITTTKRH